MREALIFATLLLVAQAGVLGAQPATLSYVGASGCSSSICHGGTTAQPESESRILANEYATWTVNDKHSRAYKALEDPRGKRMGEILKLDATRDKRCTVCHVVGSPERTRSDGVSCEACHGSADKWLGPHRLPNSHAESVKTGMIDTKDLVVRTKTCLACHLGTGDQIVDHELVAAGHPDLAFELDTFTAGQPSHHRPEKPAARVRAWALGQTIALAESMRLYAARPEDFSHAECYQCHHDLRSESWRIQRGYGARRPGSLQLNQSRIEMVRELVAVAAPEQRPAFEAAIGRLNGADAAQTVARIADGLTARFQAQDVDAQAVIRALTANIGRIADSGVGAAEQATMALDSLGAALGRRPQAVMPLYDYLEHPSTYRPAEFAELFRKASNE